MKIAMTFDHAGFDYKAELVDFVKCLGHDVDDYGTTSSASCDYPDLAIPACESVVSGKNDCAILVCGTGIGMSITANKVHGIRCALCHEQFSARMTREHNNANALALGARVTGIELAKEIVRTFLETDFPAAERNARRIGKITAYEGTIK